MISKKDRLTIFLSRLAEAAPAKTADDGLNLVSATLNAGEDEFSGVAFNPDAWVDDGRMYPPTEKNRRAAAGNASLRRYRSARHNTFIGLNGSVRIEDIDGKVLLDKPGADGRRPG